MIILFRHVDAQRNCVGEGRGFDGNAKSVLAGATTAEQYREALLAASRRQDPQRGLPPLVVDRRPLPAYRDAKEA